MKYHLDIQDDVYYDMQDGYDYYESRLRGLGDKFMRTVKQYIKTVHKYPLHYQIKYDGFREAYIKQFPYVIIFEIEENTVIVYSVFNTYKNLNKKPRKE